MMQDRDSKGLYGNILLAKRFVLGLGPDPKIPLNGG